MYSQLHTVPASICAGLVSYCSAVSRSMWAHRFRKNVNSYLKKIERHFKEILRVCKKKFLRIFLKLEGSFKDILKKKLKFFKNLRGILKICACSNNFCKNSAKIVKKLKIFLVKFYKRFSQNFGKLFENFWLESGKILEYNVKIKILWEFWSKFCERFEEFSRKSSHD